MTERLGPDEVLRLAGLARLELTRDEAARLATELAGVLAHFESIRSADVRGVAPFLRPTELADVLRDDVPRPGLAPDDALAGAPDPCGGAFRVPRVKAQPGG